VAHCFLVYARRSIDRSIGFSFSTGRT
jgi:hypothetical protein